MLYGIERGCCFQGKYGELIIAGGRFSSGDTNLTYIYNFERESVFLCKKMLKERVLQNSFELKDFVYVFGGDNDGTYEKFNKRQYNWENFSCSLEEILLDQSLKGFSSTKRTINLNSSNEDYYLDNKNENFNINIRNQEDSTSCIFGTDAEPFIIDLNHTKNSFAVKDVPTSLKLLGYQSGIILNKEEYFIAGGLAYSKKRISNNCFIYNFVLHKAYKMAKMNDLRYTFNLILKGNYIYAIAGRTYGDDNVGILNKCERYSINENIWINIASLNFKRCTSMAMIYQNSIYVAGGFVGFYLFYFFF